MFYGSVTNRAAVPLALLLAFLIMLAYALLRPVSEALFLEYYHAERLPQAWILIGVTILILVKINDYLARRLRPAIVLAVWTAISMAMIVCAYHAVEAGSSGSQLFVVTVERWHL